MLFHEMSDFLELVGQKLMKMPKHASLPQKVLLLAKSMIFHPFSRNERLFLTLDRKVDENAETC